MSGGVDSSVAAHLLLGAGHQVIGVFMRHGHQSPAACPTSGPNSLPVVERLDHKQGCCTAADAEDARRVADRLDIPFYAIDLNAEFGRIMDYFAEEYARGRTPNPCVQCNNWIKFGKLFDYADSVGAQYVATGHYARLLELPDGPALVRGIDSGKDQSYVLFGIERRLLGRMLLPVGDYRKDQIRQLATEIGLDVAAKKDSQEICFVTRSRYDQFVRHRLGELQGGELVDTAGNLLGRHQGIEGFTVGQRKGLGQGFGARKYVVRIESDTRRVVLGDRQELGGHHLMASDTNWLIEIPLGEPQQGLAQIRYNAPAAPAIFERLPNNKLRVEFSQAQFAIAPGQAVVCYQDQRVVGGGWID